MNDNETTLKSSSFALAKATMSSSSSSSCQDAMDRYIEMCGGGSGGAIPSTASIRVLIHHVLGNPNIVSGFYQLCQIPEIQKALSSNQSSAGEGAAALRTLELFAFGTVSDYKQAEDGRYLQLTNAQIQKLRQLTVVSLVQRAAAPRTSSSSRIGRASLGQGRANTLSYSTLYSELGMNTTNNNSLRELEDILIQCIYSGMISGKLDQRQQCFVILPNHDSANSECGGGAIPRDVNVAKDIRTMIAQLEQFQTQTLGLLQSLEAASCFAADTRRKGQHAWKNVEERIAQMHHRPKGGGGSAVAVAVAAASGESGQSIAAAAGMDVDMGAGGAAGTGGDHYHSRDRKSKRSRAGMGVTSPQFDRGGYRNG